MFKKEKVIILQKDGSKEIGKVIQIKNNTAFVKMSRDGLVLPFDIDEIMEYL
jgi:hypothetical protein